MRVILLGLAVGLSGFQPAFRSGVELVRIPVNVSSTADTPVDVGGLTAADFVITEDGVPQQAALFERESVPLSLCILLDISHSMGEQAAAHLATGAYGHVVSLLEPGDEVSVITFAMDASVAVPWTPAEKAARARLALKTEGGTAIVDGVRSALRQVDKTTRRRPVILVITDGGENASRTAMSELVATRRQSETELYAFRIAPPAPAPTPPPVVTRDALGRIKSASPPRTSRAGATPAITIDVLPQLVDDSGGVIYAIGADGDVPVAARRFLDEVRLQYTIAYSPARSFDGKYRRVKVDVTRPGLRIRHRGGYLALPR